jgi:hypothetical protein
MAILENAPEPAHDAGTRKGEEMTRGGGKEPGRHHIGHTGAGRPAGKSTPRHSTGINPDHRRPIHPESPYLPPA